MTARQDREQIRTLGRAIAAEVRRRMERQRAEQQQHNDEHDAPAVEPGEQR